MTATWTAPKTWTPGELVTADLLNTHLRNNLEFLKTPSTNNYRLDEGANYTTTSTSFVDIDVNKLSLPITTAGGDVLIGLIGTATDSLAGSVVYFDIALDGTRLGGDDGIFAFTTPTGNYSVPVTVLWLARNVSAAAHTFKVQWKVGSGTGKWYGGDNVASSDVHTQFFVREI